mgnify:FL=1
MKNAPKLKGPAKWLRRLVRRLTRWAWSEQLAYYQNRLSGEPDEHMRIIAKTYKLEGRTWSNVVYYLVKQHPPKSSNESNTP